MASSLLDIFSLTPDRVLDLHQQTRQQLLDFLVRWEGYQEALACISFLEQSGISSPHFLDRQAQALAGLGQFKDALQVMEARLRQHNDLPGWLLYGRYLLDAGQKRKALRSAKQLVTLQSTAPAAWSLLGDVQRRQKRIADAERAYLQALKYDERWPAAQIGLMLLYHSRGDRVTAVAYAVRAYANVEGKSPLPADEFQQLLDFFTSIRDRNWMSEASRRLKSAFDAELSQIQEALGNSHAKSATRAADPADKPFIPSGTAPSESISPQRISPLRSLASPQEERALTAAAKKHFGFATLRSPQAEVMACARRGENVLAILPTGAGKSLCYQLLAFADAGITLVISPLIALMKDQIDNLPPQLQTRTIAFNSALKSHELRRAMEQMAKGELKLIYAAPERLRQLPFLHALRRGGLTRLVIDEAHCVSIWGHDFRPDYLHIAQAHKDLGGPPIMALTATAPPQVRHDIQRQLFGISGSARQREQFQIITTDTFRPNLKLSAIRAANNDERLDYLITLCRDLVKTGSGLVYARTRRRCEEVAELLRSHGIRAEHYHAGVSNRDELQERFMANDIQVVVATIAFGMGVDKPDIRFVIHHGLPDSVEAYYQEVGRAGRDGKASRCVLIYTNRDKDLLRRHAGEALVSVDHLRLVFRCVGEQLAGKNPGLLSLRDLKAELPLDQIQLRVALSTLEEVGLLKRYYDTPRFVRLKLLGASMERKLKRLAQAASLDARRWVECDYLELARASGIDAESLESELLRWQDAEILAYSSRGRTPLLSLEKGTARTANRIQSLLDQHATIQMHRVSEIVAYAHTQNCRHGHLSGYLGGEPRGTCGSCDNCLERQQFERDPDVPDERAQYQLVLRALAKGGWGKRNLTRLLRGTDDTPQRGRANDSYGKLHFRTEASVEQLITRLLQAGYIRENRLDHGGIALELTQRGRRAARGGEQILL